MSDFIELTEGLVVRKESIGYVVDNFDGTITVSSLSKEFTIKASFSSVVDEIDEEHKKELEMEEMTNQYFGG